MIENFVVNLTDVGYIRESEFDINSLDLEY